MVPITPLVKRLRAKEADVKRDQSNRLRSPVKFAVSLLAIIIMALSAVPNAWSQDSQNKKDKQQTKKPAPEKKLAVKRKPFGDFRGSIDFAAQTIHTAGDRTGKFEEFREYRQGFSFRNLRMKSESANSPYVVNFKALEVSERDQRYSAEIEKVGKFRTRFLWDQIPHYYDVGRTLHKLTGPGFLSVDPALRASLEAAPNAGNPAQTLGTALPALVSQAVQAAPTVQLRVRWDQFLVTQSFRPNKNWEFYFRAQHLRFNGTRPRDTGTFARQNIFPTSIPGVNDGVWESLGMELPEPVSQHTTNLTFGFQYSRPRWRVGMEYFISLFRNNIPTLTWENPFRVTDALSSGPPTFPIGRNRFVRAQLAEAPDNNYQSFSVHASVDLPRDTQLRGEFSWGRGTQNQPFLPYTLNSAMITANLTGVLAGQPGLFGLALPRPSLNGVVRTLNGDVALASKPWHDMRFLIQYRGDDMQNQSPIITFPGLPLFGDSTVRTAIDNYGLAMENFPTSYTRHDTTATWQWDVSKKLNWELEYNWEIWNRTFRDVPKSNEHSLEGKLDYKPWRGVSLKGDYLYSHRIPTAYLTQPLVFNPNLNINTAAAPISGGPGWEATLAIVAAGFVRGLPLEFNQLRRFDEADRVRKDGGISLEIGRSEKINYSISWRYLRDDYDKNFWGLRYGVQSTVDAQLNYFPKGGKQDEQTAAGGGGWMQNSFFYANYSRELDQTGYRGMGNLINGAGTNVRACCAQYPINNSWDRASKINLDMFQFGFNTSTEGEKTVLDISYGLGFARDRTNTTNPFPILGQSPRTAGTYNYPDVINRQQEVNLSLTHKLWEGLDLGFSYRYEPYRLSDYYTNSLVPYGVTQVAGGTFGSNTPRQLFLDARFTSYHSNVATGFLRYSF
jgi:MtrB/PioB family decaheme-associated outer membrane protein